MAHLLGCARSRAHSRSQSRGPGEDGALHAETSFEAAPVDPRMAANAGPALRREGPGPRTQEAIAIAARCVWRRETWRWRRPGRPRVLRASESRLPCTSCSRAQEEAHLEVEKLRMEMERQLRSAVQRQEQASGASHARNHGVLERSDSGLRHLQRLRWRVAWRADCERGCRSQELHELRQRALRAEMEVERGRAERMELQMAVESANKAFDDPVSMMFANPAK